MPTHKKISSATADEHQRPRNIKNQQMSLLNHRSLFSLLLMVPQIESFQLRIPSHSHPISTTTLTLLQAQEGNQERQDLFDYFDPLLSPHAYPNGIDAGASSSESSSTTNTPSESTSSSPLGFVPSSAQSESVPGQSSSVEEGNRQGQDLFDYFDPLLSPHAYPNGINAGASNTAEPTNDPNAPTISSSVPPSPLEVVARSQSTTGKKKVGVLLMDHGSRNSASNARLEKMAELYQLTANYDRTDDCDAIVVEPAHMEIASPSIAEGLKKLLDQGVGK